MQEYCNSRKCRKNTHKNYWKYSSVVPALSGVILTEAETIHGYRNSYLQYYF